MGICRAALVLAAALVAGITGCGGEAEQDGAKLFESAGCSGCHTLAAADADGTVGPNLDELGPTAERVASLVAKGGAGMPSFAGRLSDEEIRAVAEFVSQATDGATGGELATFEPDDTKLSDCSEGDGHCYRQAFANLAFRAGPGVALARFERAIGADPAIEQECHPVAHWIGAGALLRYDGNIGRALADGSPVCGSGYYHGLLEWKLAGVSEDEVVDVAQRVCAEESIRSEPFIYYQCIHGLGHGAMLYTGYDLPEALELCHSLETDFDQTSCTGGVFMENQSSSYGVTSEWLSEEDLIYPCNAVDDRDKLYCYLLISSRILREVDWDWGEAAEWCRKSEPRWVPICFQSYGRDASGQARQSPEGIERRCRFARDMAAECLFGGVRDILNNDPEDVAARHLCSRQEGAERRQCVEGIGSMVGVRYSKERDRVRACRRLAPAADVAECVRASYSAVRPS